MYVCDILDKKPDCQPIVSLRFPPISLVLTFLISQ